MESQTTTESRNGVGDGNASFCSVLERFRLSFRGFAMRLAKIVTDDPRRVVHSLKVGLALTLVSVLYYVTALFNRWGDSAAWAVITIVVVMEFTVGGTRSKGLNRAFATLMAGLLAVGAHLAAQLCGQMGEPILLGVFVFLVAFAATFSRFIPEVKATYDYGVNIFILTFTLVTVSSYRVEDLIEFAHERVTTVAVATCLFTTIFVFPVWAGEDLHKLAAGNLDKLAEFLAGMESEYFGESSSCENLEGKSFLQVYKGVLNSKAREDSLYPEANPGICLKIGDTCAATSLHSAKALRELSKVRTMTKPSPNNMDMSIATKAASDLLRTELSQDVTVLRVMHVTIVASLLSDIVIQIERIVESTNNLAHLACFKNPERSPGAVIVNIED